MKLIRVSIRKKMPSNVELVAKKAIEVLTLIGSQSPCAMRLLRFGLIVSNRAFATG